MPTDDNTAMRIFHRYGESVLGLIDHIIRLKAKV